MMKLLFYVTIGIIASGWAWWLIGTLWDLAFRFGQLTPLRTMRTWTKEGWR